jgi:hypothetical protein
LTKRPAQGALLQIQLLSQQVCQHRLCWNACVVKLPNVSSHPYDSGHLSGQFFNLKSSGGDSMITEKDIFDACAARYKELGDGQVLASIPQEANEYDHLL